MKKNKNNNNNKNIEKKKKEKKTHEKTLRVDIEGRKLNEKYSSGG